MERFLGLVRANRRRDVAADTAVAEEATVRVKHGLATRGDVDYRSVGARGPVDEAAKRLVCFERRDMQAPLLGLLLDVGGEVPPRHADPGRDAERGELVRDAGERVVLASLPEPIRGGRGVIAEAVFSPPQRLLGPSAVSDVAAQSSVGR